MPEATQTNEFEPISQFRGGGGRFKDADKRWVLTKVCILLKNMQKKGRLQSIDPLTAKEKLITVSLLTILKKTFPPTPS